MKLILLLVSMLLVLPLSSAVPLTTQYMYMFLENDLTVHVIAKLDFSVMPDNGTQIITLPEKDINNLRIVQEFTEYKQECSQWKQQSCGNGTCLQQCIAYHNVPVLPKYYTEVKFSYLPNLTYTIILTLPRSEQTNLTVLLSYETTRSPQNDNMYEFQSISISYPTQLLIMVAEQENAQMNYTKTFRKEAISGNVDLAALAPYFASLPGKQYSLESTKTTSIQLYYKKPETKKLLLTIVITTFVILLFLFFFQGKKQKFLNSRR